MNPGMGDIVAHHAVVVTLAMQLRCVYMSTGGVVVHRMGHAAFQQLQVLL